MRFGARAAIARQGLVDVVGVSPTRSFIAVAGAAFGITSSD
jgi:hypothetical protein